MQVDEFTWPILGHAHFRIHTATLAFCWLSDGCNLEYRLYYSLSHLQLDYKLLCRRFHILTILFCFSFFAKLIVTRTRAHLGTLKFCYKMKRKCWTSLGWIRKWETKSQCWNLWLSIETLKIFLVNRMKFNPYAVDSQLLAMLIKAKVSSIWYVLNNGIYWTLCA